MKTKLLLTLFLVSLGFGAFASEHHKKRPRTRCKVQNRVATRVPFEPSIWAEDFIYMASGNGHDYPRSKIKKLDKRDSSSSFFYLILAS